MKNLLQFIDGSVPMAEKTDSLYHAWRRCNTLILVWIRNLVSTSISQSIMYIDKAKDAWEDLLSRFSQKYVLRMADI